MSVRKGERKESNLKYIQDAQILCQYTINMCNNTNHFPEPVLSYEIKHEVLEILKNIRYSFATYTYNKKNIQLISRYQVDALAHIDALYALLDLVYNDNTYKIAPNSMEYWIGLVINVEDSLKNLGSIPICTKE